MNSLTTDQKLDYLIQEVKEVKKDTAELKQDVSGLKKDTGELKQGITKLRKDTTGLKKDVKHIKRELADHTEMLQHLIANAVSLQEFQVLEKRVAFLEDSN